MRVHLLEIKYEFLKALRLPAYVIPTLLFPVGFYLFFSTAFGGRAAGSSTVATYLIGTYGTFGVMAAAFFGFGVSIAIERGQGWLEAKRTTPMPISAYFVAKTAMAMAFSLIVVLLLMTAGVVKGGVQLSFAQAATMLGILVAGSSVFCALGLVFGFFAGPNSAAPLINMVFLPMSFLSGLWVPVHQLPQALQKFAHWLPPYHLSQLALRVIGADRGESIGGHVLALAAFGAIFSALAYAGYRRDEGKLYG
ncbi:MAG TPA: ABC transporter permease [Thermoanaerobaculia bacterium]|jgi:ABC-2 type transport system permease protein